MATTLKKNLQGLIECGICLDPMVDPRVLSCQHSFCAECLINLLSHSDIPVFTCPTCRRDTPVPRRGVHDLPHDFRANTLTEFMKEPEKDLDKNDKKKADHNPELEPDEFIACGDLPECASCSNKKSTFDSCEVKFFCKFCKDYMCNPCALDHKGTSVFKKHVLVKIPENRWRTEKCPQHPPKSQEYYCGECNVLICSACVTNQHKEHHVRHFVEQFKDCSVDMGERLGRLDIVFSESFIGNVNGEELKNHRSAFNKAILEMVTQVENSADFAMKQIEKEKASLLSSLEQDQVKINEGFKDLEGQSLKTDVKDVLETCNAYLKTKSQGELLKDFKGLSLKIDKATSSLEESQRKVASFLISQVPTEFLPSKQEITIGSVKSGKIETSKLFPNAQLALLLSKATKEVDIQQQPSQALLSAGTQSGHIPEGPSPPMSPYNEESDWSDDSDSSEWDEGSPPRPSGIYRSYYRPRVQPAGRARGNNRGGSFQRSNANQQTVHQPRDWSDAVTPRVNTRPPSHHQPPYPGSSPPYPMTSAPYPVTSAPYPVTSAPYQAPAPMYQETQGWSGYASYEEQQMRGWAAPSSHVYGQTYQPRAEEPYDPPSSHVYGQTYQPCAEEPYDPPSSHVYGQTYQPRAEEPYDPPSSHVYGQTYQPCAEEPYDPPSSHVYGQTYQPCAEEPYDPPSSHVYGQTYQPCAEEPYDPPSSHVYGQTYQPCAEEPYDPPSSHVYGQTYQPRAEEPYDPPSSHVYGQTYQPRAEEPYDPPSSHVYGQTYQPHAEEPYFPPPPQWSPEPTNEHPDYGEPRRARGRGRGRGRGKRRGRGRGRGRGGYGNTPGHGYSTENVVVGSDRWFYGY